MSDSFNSTDLLLLREIKDDNENALNELIVKYRNTVDFIASKYINAPLEKDDLIQEGMIGLLAAIKSFNTQKDTKFITYASRCINNSIRNAIKRVSRLKDIPQDSIIGIDDAALETQYVLSAEDEYLAKESVSTLTDILYEGLSSFENEVLRLHIVGCSYGEIAEKLGKNQKSVDNAIQRIRKKLSGVTF